MDIEFQLFSLSSVWATWTSIRWAWPKSTQTLETDHSGDQILKVPNFSPETCIFLIPYYKYICLAQDLAPKQLNEWLICSFSYSNDLILMLFQNTIYSGSPMWTEVNQSVKASEIVFYSTFMCRTTIRLNQGTLENAWHWTGLGKKWTQNTVHNKLLEGMKCSETFWNWEFSHKNPFLSFFREKEDNLATNGWSRAATGPLTRGRALRPRQFLQPVPGILWPMVSGAFECNT